MRKIAVFVIGCLSVFDAWADVNYEFENEPHFFIEAYTNLYSRYLTKLRIEYVAAMDFNSSAVGTNGGFAIGYDIENFQLGLTTAFMDIGDFNVSDLAMRFEIPVCDWWIQPYAVIQIGWAHIEYDDGLAAVGDDCVSAGVGAGIRFLLNTNSFAKISVNYNRVAFHDSFENVIDMDLKLRGLTFVGAVGYRF